MTINEAKQVINMLRQSGANDDQIAKSFAMMFINDEINENILEALMHVLGHELTDEFKRLTSDQKKINLRKIYKVR